MEELTLLGHRSSRESSAWSGDKKSQRKWGEHLVMGISDPLSPAELAIVEKLRATSLADACSQARHITRTRDPNEGPMPQMPQWDPYSTVGPLCHSGTPVPQWDPYATVSSLS
jgi:hypothetical protein